MAGDAHIFLSMTNPAPGQEEAYNRWYDEHHLPDMLGLLPQFVAGQRYVAEPGKQRPGTKMKWRYTCLYEAQLPHPASLFPTLTELRKTSPKLPDVLQPDSHGWLYQAIGPRRMSPNGAPAGPHHLMFALTNAVKAEEDNFNRWYDEVHVPEVLKYIPGYVSAQRYRLSPFQRKETAPEWEYLTIYEVDSSDLAVTHAQTSAIARTSFSPLESMAPGHAAWTWSPTGPRRQRG
jgi:hypothetical protein